MPRRLSSSSCRTSRLWRTNCESESVQEKAEAGLIPDEQRGEQAAISELFRRHYSSCLLLANRILRSEEESRDAVQSAFLSAFRHLHSFRGDSTFKTWLGRIIVNECFMHLRRPEHRLTWVDLDSLYASGLAERVTSPALTPEKLALSGEIGAALADGVARLPEPLRQVFSLYAVSGLSLREVAEALGLTLSAVKTRLFRARLRMRSHLQPIWSDLRIHRTAAATRPANISRTRGNGAAASAPLC
jgi:RNA polymerase sigma-70 factor (ECF subfamily)